MLNGCDANDAIQALIITQGQNMGDKYRCHGPLFLGAQSCKRLLEFHIIAYLTHFFMLQNRQSAR
jgi:hypothetical protein